MNNYLIWVVATITGGYRAYKQKPTRDTTKQQWQGDYDAKGQVALAHLEGFGLSLPSLTWESEPVQLNITLSWESETK